MTRFFLEGGGIISEHIRSINWAESPLGAIEQWPDSLKTSLSICLNSPFPMLICWGPEMTMLYNQGYTAYLDDPLYAFGKAAKEIWADIWDDISPKLEGVMSTGESLLFDDQLFMLARNGVREERYFTFAYSPIWDDEKIVGIQNISYETTEKVLNHRLAKMEQERMRRILSQAPAAICILEGPELVFDVINQNYQQLFQGRNLLGKPVLEALPEIKGEAIHQILTDVYQTGKTFTGTETMVRLSRSEGGPLENRYFNFIYQAKLNVQKEVDGIIVFAFEVTDFVNARNAAKQLALEIEHQAEIFRISLDSIQDMVYTFDVDGKFTYSNHTLLDLLGITLDEIIGKTFYDLPYPPDLAHTLQSQITQVIETGNLVKDDTLFVSPSGITGYYEYIFTPVFDKEGKVVLVAGSTRDITAHKKSEEAIKIKNEELTHLNNQLMRVNSDLDNFVYSASHDLKTPISNIEGLVNTLGEFLPTDVLEDPVVGDLLDMIKGSIERFNRTIHDLSDITKLQRMNEEPEHLIDLEEMIENIKMDLSFLFKESSGLLQLDLCDIKQINFSPKNLRSVFYNLISNSLKYRSPDREPVIKISCQQNEEFFIVTVEDNGLGMDLSSGESIFGLFRRLHNHVEGTGIGLYIVKKIMDNAGGKIEVESEVGVGSVFRLYFKKNPLIYEETRLDNAG